MSSDEIAPRVQHSPRGRLVYDKDLKTVVSRLDLFLVQRRGVYDQGIVGIFDDENVAIEMAKDAFKEEQDNYHRFLVMEFQLNKRVDVSSEGSTGEAIYLSAGPVEKVLWTIAYVRGEGLKVTEGGL